MKKLYSPEYKQGDNAVLAQKVAKELLAAIDAGDYKLVSVDLASTKRLDLGKVEDCVKLIQVREAVVVNSVRNLKVKTMAC